MSIRIYIDQGHNPSNPNAGAEGNGLREQDITFTVGLLLSELLSEDGRFEVRLSRPTPETSLGGSVAESLSARVRGANEWGADYFLSIHANASDVTEASGSEAYVYGRRGEGYPLAEHILIGLNEETGLRNRGVFVRPSLYVLRRTVMPAVLTELGYITNPGDARLMETEPSLFARGIYRGLLSYFGLG